MPTVNSSYWILSNLTAQLALLFLYYVVLQLRFVSTINAVMLNERLKFLAARLEFG